MTYKNNDCESKREMLRGFENWSQWADFMQVIPKEKKFWDVVNKSRVNPTTAAPIRKKKKDNIIASKIIK